jgi:hypothetical protein
MEVCTDGLLRPSFSEGLDLTFGASRRIRSENWMMRLNVERKRVEDLFAALI